MHDDNEEFSQQRKERIASYSTHSALSASAEQFLTASLKQNYSYNFDWLGLPIIQYPQDMVALQEIIWRYKPELIIETGIARGGSLIFYASLLELLGSNGQVLGIDIDLRKHNRDRILQHPLSRRIRLLDGSSIDEKIISEVAKISEGKRLLVILDSNHTHEHVLAELNAYTPLIAVGGYCIVFDTIIELMPDGFYSDRPWDKGNNPMTAVRSFISQHPEWEIDVDIEAKLQITAAKSGYLKRTR